MWSRGPGRRGGRRGARSGGLSRRRPKEWQSAELLGGTDLIVPGICVAYPLILADELDAEYSDSTLARVRGLYHVMPAIPVASPTQLTSYGAIGIIELEGVDDSGLNTPWCPLTDSDASWIWHNYYSVRQTTFGAAGTPALDVQDQRGEIDTAAMRRLEAGDSALWLIFESDAASDGSVEFWFGARFIISEK